MKKICLNCAYFYKLPNQDTGECWHPDMEQNSKVFIPFNPKEFFCAYFTIKETKHIETKIIKEANND